MSAGLAEVLTTRFRRLLVLRWSSQTSDGLFQSGLASFLLFSPERAPTALAVATGFAVVLLPYSLIGPLVGTILDRFDRRAIMLLANSVRAGLLTIIAILISQGISETGLIPWVLICFGLSRLVLAGLSAGLPRVVSTGVLVPANAIAVTGGTLASVIGGGVGLGLRTLTSPWSSNASDAAIVSLAAVLYAVAALSALRLRAMELGPVEHEQARTWTAGFIDLRLGLRHLRQHRAGAWAITRVALVRGGMSALIVASILLHRSVFTTDPDQAIAGLATVVTAMGVGSLLGATITPRATRRWSREQWMQRNLHVAALFATVFAVTQTPLLLPITMFLIAMAGQSIKVTADAQVQTTIVDEFRGRVFAVYDMSVNVAIVIGAYLAASTLPVGARSVFLPLLIAVVWLGTASVDMLLNRTQRAR